MATLVLTTVGSAIGGPIGGALGAVLGQQVDQRFLAPRRQGARLGALTVQTSAYGQPIPKLFGTLRVAGTVIWATHLREERSNSGGRKGKPRTTSYSYSASFAVALSGRPIRAVHRIWADGKLLRGAAGDWKSETGFRLYPGDEAQAADPLLAATEGAGGTPAYRGTAYAVFEDLQLADFGNRIPSLTFEVEADVGPVMLGSIAEALSGGVAGGATRARLAGYAAGGDSVRGAIEALTRALPLSVRDDGTRLEIGDDGADPVPLDAVELGATGGAGRSDRLIRERQASGTLPDEVTIAYYEPARDYQAGLQRARRGGPGRRIEAIELAAALDASEAKAIAENRLATAWAERATGTVTLPWRRLDLKAGDAVSAGTSQAWRIAGWTLENMTLALKLRALRTGVEGAVSAAPGRVASVLDVRHGPTTIALLDLPPLDDAQAAPRLWLAASGAAAGWRRASVIASSDGGASWTDFGVTAAPAIMGRTTKALASGDCSLFDEASTVVIELLREDMMLVSRDRDALVNGANLAMIGAELMQFGTAHHIGGARWRLGGMLRGRRGTEQAIAGHVSGERFVLVDAATLLPIEIPAERIGATLRVLATGLDDPTGVAAEADITGRALRPPEPVHVEAATADGGVRFGWTRRSRLGWTWSDGGEVPLAEESERYRLTITPSTGTSRTVETTSPSFLYGADLRLADGAGAAATFMIAVVQLGMFAASAEAIATFTPNGPDMTESTAKFALPLLQAGQAQKEIFHNEALTVIEMAICPVAQTLARNDPPPAPSLGQGWIVGTSPTGAWAGHGGRLCAWTGGGWRFMTPVAGMQAWIADAARWAWHDGAGWKTGPLPTGGISVGGDQVVGARMPAIASPQGGTAVDPEGRATIGAILSALRGHGLIAT